MNNELPYIVIDEIYRLLYNFGLAFILYTLSKPLFKRKFAAIGISLGYFITLTFLGLFPGILSNLFAYTIASSLAFLIMLIVEKGNIASKVLWSIFFFTMRWLLPRVVNFFQITITDTFFPTAKGPMFLVITWSIEYTILFVLFYLICQHFIHYLSALKIDWKVALIIAIPAFIGVVSYVILDEFQQVPFSFKIEFLLTCFYLLLIVVIMLFIRLYGKNELARTEILQQQGLMTQLAYTKQHLENVQVLYDELKGLKHDLINHFEIVEQLIETKHYKEAADYSESIREKTSGLSAIQTGHPVTDIILQEKLKLASAFKINLTSRFSYPVNLIMDPFDISVILNNTLDNAIEASKTIENSTIEIHSSKRNDIYMITIKNKINSIIEWDSFTNLPVSNKASAGHGIGLQNVRMIASKYDGELLFKYDNHTFSVTIILIGHSTEQ